MKPLNLVVIFGGTNTEHEVSLVSARSILNHLDPKKYRLLPVIITKDNRWLAPKQFTSTAKAVAATHHNSGLLPLIPQDLIHRYHIDIVFPVLHGPYGEDGTIQGMLQLMHLPYVGCAVLSSAICMDKLIQKQLCLFHKLPIVPFTHTTTHAWAQNQSAVLRSCSRLGYPVFVKPANQGSSIGVTKVAHQHELITAIHKALILDTKVIIEQAVPNAREIECAILGDHQPRASLLGEIIPSNDFYDYQAKYVDGRSKEVIPANLPKITARHIRSTAIKAFKLLNCSGLARVDFLVEQGTGKFYLSELNTMPGFTTISMYPKLWQASGLTYPQLLDELVQLALDRHQERSRLSLDYQPQTAWHKK